MVDPLNITAEAASTIITEVGRIGLWLQALGVIAVLWVGFQTYNLVMANRRKHTLKDIKDSLNRIERKINRLEKK